MLALADFLDTLLRGTVLAGLALSLGGLAWQLWVLRAWRARAPEVATRRGLALVAWGAIVVAIAQALALILKALVLSDSFGPAALDAFTATVHFAASVARIAAALALTGATLWLARAVHARGRWLVVTALATALAACGAWLTHAAGRLEDGAWLMALTALHQLSASVWAGGLAALARCWRLARRDPALDALWPELVARFSRLAIVAVIALVLTALPLTWTYAASLGGLVGTGYGALALTKVVLLAAALLLAAFNLSAARRSRETLPPAALRNRLPHLAEAEAIILAMSLFTAATLSSQPPPVDVPDADRASASEVAEVFRPKIPSLHTPSLEAMRRDRAEASEGERSREAYLWSNYSHNVAGLILLGTSAIALVGIALRPDGGRHWPLGFIGLAAFVYLRAAANEGTWPFGAMSLAHVSAEGVQHRIAAVLVLSLGMLEWRARIQGQRAGLVASVFPAVAAAGAVLLLTHSHTAFQTKASFLVQVTHTAMGALAVLLVAARWLELRLAPPAARVAGAAASAAMLGIALILVFYREANVAIPPN